MLSQSIKMAWRVIRKNKSTFFINVLGLSTGLACALLILMWISDELKIDKYHEKDDRLFYVMEHQEYANNIMTTLSTPGVLARTLKQEIPEIEFSSTLMWPQQLTLTVEDQNIKASGRYVEPDFLHLFTHPLLRGQKDNVLRNPASVVITETLAQRLFGSIEDAYEKTIRINHEDFCTVTGILEDVPKNSSQTFDLLLPYEPFLQKNDWLSSWGNNAPPTAVGLRKGTDVNSVNKKIANIVKDHSEESNVTLFLKQFSSLYLYGKYINGKLAGGRIEYVKLFGIIAVFLLLIACINFMNLSTAHGTTRAKEVGVKKTLGMPKISLITQYLSESVITALFSLLISFLWIILLLPKFNSLTEKELEFPLSASILIAFFGIAIITGLVAGSYPALYLSSFKPVEVLRGKLSASLGELWARKGLVVFQFTMSVILILSVIVVYRQIQFVQSKNLGYEKDQLINFSLDGKLEENGEFFAERLRKLPGIKNAGTIAHDLVGRQNNTSGLEWEGKNPEDRILFENVRVGYDLLETIGVEILEGRTFSREFGQDTTRIIFNETAINVMNMKDPVGKRIRLWDEYDLEIIGVVKDFHFQSLHEPVKPLFFWLAPEQTWYMMVKLEAGREEEALKDLESLYADHNPGFPFEYRFVDEEYAAQYAAEQRVSRLSRYFAGLAILISCLGLFGLAAFTGERRKKEIGIRKVLGASVGQIVLLLTRDFTRLVILAIILGLPVAYLLLRNWLERFEYRITLQPAFFVIAGALLLVIAWITVSSQAWKSALVHPGESMKEE